MKIIDTVVFFPWSNRDERSVTLRGTLTNIKLLSESTLMNNSTTGLYWFPWPLTIEKKNLVASNGRDRSNKSPLAFSATEIIEAQCCYSKVENVRKSREQVRLGGVWKVAGSTVGDTDRSWESWLQRSIVFFFFFFFGGLYLIIVRHKVES